MTPEENVLVVPTGLFHSLGHFQGFCTQVERYRDSLLSGANVRFERRSLMEKNPAYKQLIPYMIFCWTNDAGITHIFSYVRGKGMGEARLHSKRSIGVGGHINDTDLRSSQAAHDPARDLYHEGMNRERDEEVRTGSPFREVCVGLINDDESEVGRVHLGIVHRFDLERPDLQPNEEDLIESGFVPVPDLLAMPDDAFETWSAICLKALFS